VLLLMNVNLNRIVPVLLLQDDGLVKGKRFKRHRYIGDPINAVKIFNDKEVDEIVVLDISKTAKSVEPDYTLIEQIASEAFMPLTYGGGITHIDHVHNLFNCGVEKIVLGTSAFYNPDLVSDLCDRFGGQSVVCSVDYRVRFFNKVGVYVKNGTKYTGLSLLEYIGYLQDLGVGELLLNDIDRDGTRLGFNITQLQEIADAIRVPAVACCGAGSLEDIRDLFDHTCITSVGAGSLFVFKGGLDGILINYPSRVSIEKVLGI
jgi:cyclase